jgi:hypothetical protein
LALIPIIKDQSNCTVFTWDQQPSYLTYNDPQERIAAGVACEANASHPCALHAAGNEYVEFTHNLTNGSSRYNRFQDPTWTATLSNGYFVAESFLHSAIFAQVNSSLGGLPWNYSVYGAIDRTVTLEPWQSGYLNFTPVRRCFVGAMSNCTGDF